VLAAMPPLPNVGSCGRVIKQRGRSSIEDTQRLDRCGIAFLFGRSYGESKLKIRRALCFAGGGISCVCCLSQDNPCARAEPSVTERRVRSSDRERSQIMLRLLSS
jgi:hypothetical protein